MESSISAARLSRIDSSEFNQRDDFWLKKVDQLLKEKKKDKALIKQYNQQILETTGQNDALSKAIRRKNSMIGHLKMDQLRERINS